jgi:hypothetical protein
MFPARSLILSSFEQSLSSSILECLYTISLQNVFVYANNLYLDNLIERCGKNNEDEDILGNYSSLSDYLCHYLGLWVTFDKGEVYDERCFLNTFILASLITSGHYIVASTILLFGGIVAGKPLSFLPWLTIKSLIIILLISMAAFEATVVGGTSCTLFVLLGTLFFALLTWFVGLVAYIKLKQTKEHEEEEWKRTNRNDYFRF